MDRLWAPWRIGYLRKLKDKRCIFCALPKQKNDKKNSILERRRSCFSILNIYPYNNGHVMVAPYKHISDIDALNEKDLLELLSLMKDTKKKIKKALKPDGFNIGLNIGKAGGAGFDGHIHIHIVPRWFGDTNFMTSVSETKVISQSLESLYNKLKRC